MVNESTCRIRRRLAFAATAVVLVAACATTASRSDAIATRAERMKVALRDAVDDPGRAGELCKVIDAMQAGAQQAIEELTAKNQEFVDRSAVYDIARADLDGTAHQVAVTRRSALESLMAQHVALRKAMSPQEWRRFADELSGVERGPR